MFYNPYLKMAVGWLIVCSYECHISCFFSISVEFLQNFTKPIPQRGIGNIFPKKWWVIASAQGHTQCMKMCMLPFWYFFVSCCHYEAFPDWNLKKEVNLGKGFNMTQLFCFIFIIIFSQEMLQKGRNGFINGQNTTFLPLFANRK